MYFYNWSDFMKSNEKIIEQIKKVENAHRKHLESQKHMIEDITKKRDFCDSRDMSLDNYKIFLDELYKLFEMKN
jgi:hypothetical protein